MQVSNPILDGKKSMSEQPKALRLADALDVLAERFSAGWHDGIKIDATDIVDNAEAADELRRLHAENEALMEALGSIADTNWVDAALDPQRAALLARAAIDAARNKT